MSGSLTTDYTDDQTAVIDIRAIRGELSFVVTIHFPVGTDSKSLIRL